MTCPFLRETNVKFCQAATMRKLIPLAQAGHAEEKCSSAAHATCTVFHERSARESDSAPDAPPQSAGLCPYLGESLMQYCGAASVSRFVPYSESVLSRCGNDSFRYCELYLNMAHPNLEAEEVEGLPLPGWLRYSSNHMWLDVGQDGTCHAGIDSFLSRALGPVEHISYVWTSGEHRPAAILTVSGIDLEVVFPNPFVITGCNLYLRANPARLASEPYNAGWLFEGKPLPETTTDLREGPEARAWMEREHWCVNQFLQDQDTHLAADGGVFAPGIVTQLPRDQAVALFHEFFSPWGTVLRYASGKRER
jgi:glycine cleavage system H protein